MGLRKFYADKQQTVERETAKGTVLEENKSIAESALCGKMNNSSIKGRRVCRYRYRKLVNYMMGTYGQFLLMLIFSVK